MVWSRENSLGKCLRRKISHRRRRHTETLSLTVRICKIALVDNEFVVPIAHVLDVKLDGAAPAAGGRSSGRVALAEEMAGVLGGV